MRKRKTLLRRIRRSSVPFSVSDQPFRYFSSMARKVSALTSLKYSSKEYILSSTRITEEVYDQNYRRDWFLFSEEMIVLGIADEIVTDIDTIL